MPSREYWRREIERAMDSLGTASGAFYYRVSGDGYELLRDRPEDREALQRASAKLEAARELISEAWRETRDINLSFS